MLQAKDSESECENQLRSTCQRIASEIENGIEITKENIDEYNDDGQYEIGDMVSGFDYIKDTLDIEYRVSSKREYLSAEILISYGGPNIWIDTKKKAVVGAWWGDYFEVSYSEDKLGIDEACEEIFGCV